MFLRTFAENRIFRFSREISSPSLLTRVQPFIADLFTENFIFSRSKLFLLNGHVVVYRFRYRRVLFSRPLFFSTYTPPVSHLPN